MIKKLEIQELRNGYLMTRVFKEGQWSIYERLDKSTKKPLSGFELIRVKVKNLNPNNPIEKKIIDLGYTEYEIYPGTSDFGSTAYDFVRLSDALAFYNKIKASTPICK